MVEFGFLKSCISFAFAGIECFVLPMTPKKENKYVHTSKLPKCVRHPPPDSKTGDETVMTIRTCHTPPSVLLFIIATFPLK
jgi:hypothetical protein